VTRLELGVGTHGPLRSAAGSFAAACTVITGDDSAALAAFVEVVSGSTPPRQGYVWLDGAVLHRTPAARRSVASLLAAESLPFARTVEEAVAEVLAARQEARRASDVLATAGLDAWSRRPPHELDHDELRSLGLVLALAHERARLWVFFEPYTTSVSRALPIDEAMERAVGRGAVVLIATASSEGATRFGGPHCVIRNGVLASIESDRSRSEVGVMA
jgi:ABC-type thiamine transport system ATPase subunit